MTLPVTTVEIAFDAGWTGTPTWTDVTSYVRHAAGISINHWRGNEGEQAAPSTLSLSLDNADGRFTPGNASGAYYPDVQKGRRIRVQSTVNGNTYDRFNGYINNWGVTWPGKVSTYSDCLVTASSRTARLGLGAELRSIIEEAARVPDLIALYTLGEPEGSLSAFDTSGEGQPPLTQFGPGAVVTFGTAIGPGTDDLTAASFAGGAGMRVATAETVTDHACGVFFSTSSASVVLAHWGANGNEALVSLDASGRIQLGGAGSPATHLITATAYNDGATHHFLYDDASTAFYVDGVSAGTFARTWSSITTTQPATFWLALGREWSGTMTTLTGTLAHATAWSRELTAGEAAEIAGAGLTGFAGDSPGDWLGRLAGFAGVPTGEQDFEAGQVADFAGISIAGKTALAAMREVETTEGGVLFDALDGTLTFHDRAHRYGASSAFTLSYSNGNISDELAPLLDDQQQVNDMTATNVNGVGARVLDTDSIDEHGYYRQSVDLATTDTLEPLSRASWTVAKYANPQTRVSSLQVLFNTLSTPLTEAVLAAEVGTKLTLTGLPSNAPASSMVLFVEGRSETITAVEDRVSLRTSPAELFDVLILDDSTYGELDAYPLAY